MKKKQAEIQPQRIEIERVTPPIEQGLTDSQVRIRLENGADVCPDVLRQLVTKGVPVSDFHRAPMNLEKVFMEVTQGA